MKKIVEFLKSTNPTISISTLILIISIISVGHKNCQLKKENKRKDEIIQEELKKKEDIRKEAEKKYYASKKMMQDENKKIDSALTDAVSKIIDMQEENIRQTEKIKSIQTKSYQELKKEKAQIAEWETEYQKMEWRVKGLAEHSVPTWMRIAGEWKGKYTYLSKNAVPKKKYDLVYQSWLDCNTAYLTLKDTYKFQKKIKSVTEMELDFRFELGVMFTKIDNNFMPMPGIWATIVSRNLNLKIGVMYAKFNDKSRVIPNVYIGIGL
jgi:hypothetical protein